MSYSRPAASSCCCCCQTQYAGSRDLYSALNPPKSGHESRHASVWLWRFVPQATAQNTDLTATVCRRLFPVKATPQQAEIHESVATLKQHVGSPKSVDVPCRPCCSCCPALRSRSLSTSNNSELQLFCVTCWHPILTGSVSLQYLDRRDGAS